MGGSNEAIVFPVMACPLLVRKKRYRGINAAKRTKGATIAASLDLEKNTDKKKPAMLKTTESCHVLRYLFRVSTLKVKSSRKQKQILVRAHAMKRH